MDDQLESFPFTQTVGGIEHSYRITVNDGFYEVEKDGCVIAEIRNDEGWKQTGGKPLSEEVLQFISDKLEDHYE